MAIEFKDPLFSLIKSLSKSEKRQFKLYSGRFEGNATSNFMSLFNLLEKAKVYSDELILSKTDIKKQQISNAKAHLYKQILRSLRLNPIHRDVMAQIREQFDFATILYNKGLYKQSLKFLDKAKSLAMKNGEINAAYEIVEFEKTIESQYITRSIINRADVLTEQAKDLSLRNVRVSKLSNLSLQLYSLMLKEGYAKIDNDSKQLKDYFEKRMPSYKIAELGFKEKMFLYKAYLWLSIINQDFVNSYKYAQRWVDLFNEEPLMKKQNPVFYLKSVNYLLESLYMLKNKTKFEEVLKLLEEDINTEHIPLNNNTETLVFLYYNQNKLNLIFLEGKFTDGLPYIFQLKKDLVVYQSLIDEHHLMVFYYKIACLYFGAGHNQKCIQYLNKIIQNKQLKLREDLLCFSRVLNLVAHYEAGLDYDIDKLIVSTYKFLIQMNDLKEVQKKMIEFLKNLSYINPRGLRKEFIKIYHEFKNYENDQYERRSFLYLDIISWLESKINNVSVESVIQKKAKELLK